MTFLLYCDHISLLGPDLELLHFCQSISFFVVVQNPLKHLTSRYHRHLAKMKSTILATALFTSAAFAWGPSCADNCIGNWNGDSCTSSSGWDCLCGNATAISTLNSCVSSACDSTDQECEHCYPHHSLYIKTNIPRSHIRRYCPNLCECRHGANSSC